MKNFKLLFSLIFWFGIMPCIAALVFVQMGGDRLMLEIINNILKGL